jgi:hypothetical protein
MNNNFPEITSETCAVLNIIGIIYTSRKLRYLRQAIIRASDRSKRDF